MNIRKVIVFYVIFHKYFPVHIFIKYKSGNFFHLFVRKFIIIQVVNIALEPLLEGLCIFDRIRKHESPPYIYRSGFQMEPFNV
ncbi:hypothetical protein ASF66_03895 [Pseudomonas sp. Leaf129]|nr:hypothetical protein ASF66_03895 [Pseudomonas sp. Leaf129]